MGMIDEIGALEKLIKLAQSPQATLLETWQMEMGISEARWTVTNPATGAPWARGVSGSFLYARVNPLANEVARLRSNQMWAAAIQRTDWMIKKVILEFEMVISAPANVDNTLFVVGFTEIAAATRATDNLCGFALIGDALQTLSDAGSTETVNTGFGETLTNHNKFGIEWTGITGTAHAHFYLNEELIASHLANVPAVPCYLNFYIDTEAAACILSLGVIRCRYEMIVR